MEGQHNEIRKSLDEEQRQKESDEKQKERLKEFLKLERVGTLSVRFEFPTVPTDPSTVRVNFTGKWVSGEESLSGDMSFFESTQMQVVRGGIQMATVSVPRLRTGIWSVSAMAVGVAFARPTRCIVPGDAFLSVTSQ